MKGMILAAGLGARLGPLTQRLPKPLVELAGKPIVVHAIERMVLHGADQIALNVSHLSEQIIEHLGDGSRWGAQLTYFREPRPTGTGGGLLAARSFFEGQSEIPVANADTYQETDWEAFLAFHREGGYAVSLALREDPGWREFGGIWRRPDRSVASIVKDPTDGECLPYLFTGAWVWSPAVFDRLEKAQPPSCLIRDAAMPMLADGEPVGGYRYEGPWHDLGTPERLEKARAALEGEGA